MNTDVEQLSIVTIVSYPNDTTFLIVEFDFSFINSTKLLHNKNIRGKKSNYPYPPWS